MVEEKGGGSRRRNFVGSRLRSSPIGLSLRTRVMFTRARHGQELGTRIGNYGEPRAKRY
jgi:hypothetical protein